MTNSIDKRIVEMSFENEKFEKGVGNSLNTIDRLKKSLNFKDSEKSFDGISAAAGRVNLGTIADGVNNISNKFSALGIIAITTLVNMTNAAIAAGTRMVKALTIDPIKTGLNEYETKLNAVQTILANTQKEGTNLDTVTKALNDLNTYSDKTIYNFQQMARNVGTFTAAGVKLDTSVQAIKGIANLAAVSGSNADQASNAMYQMSQAISTGTVRLMDWNSVVNAGMGGQVFQDAIIETAKVHGVAIDQIIKDEGSFRASLEKNWLTADILTESLAKFTGDLNADQLRTMGYSEQQIAAIIKLGQTANDAATKVKTFSQLFDTLKEAAQSGWAQTWELIIGNFEEAKSFLTDLNNWFGGILQTSANARNNLLQGWKDLGGRTELIKAFQNALNSIVQIVNPIKAAFKQIFPPATAQQLFDLTRGIEAFTKKLIIGSEMADKVKRIFAGVFAIADIVKMGVISLIKNLGLLFGSFSDTGSGLLDVTAKFGDWLVKLRDAIKSADTFNTIFGGIIKVIGPIVHGVIDFFKSLIGGFADSERVVKSNSLVNFLDVLSNKFKEFGKLGIIISKIFGILSKLAEKLGPIVHKIGEKLGDIVNVVLDKITKGLENLDVNKVLDTLNKGLFGGVLLSLNSFIHSSKDLVGKGLFAGILLSIKNFIDEGGNVFKGVTGILDGVKGSLQAYQKSLKANTLLKIAGAIALLAAAIIALTLVDQRKLVNATAVIGAMFVGLSTTLDVFEKTTSGGTKILSLTASLIGISAALLILSGTIVILGKLDPKEAEQGVLAVGAVLGLLLLFQTNLGNPAGLIGATFSILGLSVAMLGLGFAIKKLGGTDTNTLIKGLIALGASLTIVAVATNAMNASMVGSASLLVAAGAIAILAVSLTALGNLSLQQIGISLLALAGAFTVIGVAGALLTPIAPTLAVIAISLLAMGAAAGAFGLGVLGIGVGIGALAAGIVALGTVTAAGVAAISLLLTGLAALIPMLAVQVVKGVTAFVVEISKSAPKIALAIANIGLEMLKGFAKITPQVVDVVLGMIIQLQKSLLTKLPMLVETGVKVLMGFLQGMRRNIGSITTVSIDIVTNFLAGFASRLPEIVSSGWNLIISWIDAVAASAEENIPRLMTSVRALGLAIIKGILNGLISGHEEAKAGIAQIAKILIDGFKASLGIHSPSTVFMALAVEVIAGLIAGIRSRISLAVASITELANSIVRAVTEKVGSMSSAGRDLVTGFANGIKNYISTAISAASQLATAVLSKIRDVLNSHSPSQETADIGMDVDKGMALGITKFASIVLNSAKDLGNKALTGLSGVISDMSNALDDNMNVNPTIRPVMDLTDIEAGSSQIDSIFGQKKLNLSLAAVKAANVAALGRTLPTGTDATQQVDKSTAISFTQNNYSPKALPRLEIYRQTRNQLAMVKGLVGAK